MELIRRFGVLVNIWVRHEYQLKIESIKRSITLSTKVDFQGRSLWVTLSSRRTKLPALFIFFCNGARSHEESITKTVPN